MQLKTVMIIQTIGFVVAAVGTLLAPQASMAPFGVTLSEGGIGLGSSLWGDSVAASRNLLVGA